MKTTTRRLVFLAAWMAFAVLIAVALLFIPAEPEKEPPVSDKKGEAVFIVTQPGPPPTKEELESEPMYCYTIYQRPKDYPDGFVVRKWRILPGKMMDAGVHAKVPTLQAARQSLPAGLTNFGRDTHAGTTADGRPIVQVDDSCIVETWL